ncbi:segregation and condensation protein A [Mesobacillus boroniphilus JCM 21738]|uniref:Segregation and condensation protein A n=1 Tax=Mesobacillus boroniphilus JCM 21738 TaxID=1294265 RepID=W4RG69_9BACI|nr:segregation and condensation protein A [Mesobacillus boroniphilus JCM 21738]
MYTKPPSDLTEYADEIKGDNTNLDISLYDMLGAFQKLLRRKKLQRPMSTKIARQEISIEKRMDEVLSFLKKSGTRKKFYDLFPESDREHIVVTFLAILELIKRKEIDVEQEKNFAEIYMTARKE